MKPQIKIILFLALLLRNLQILLQKIKRTPWKYAPQVRVHKSPRSRANVCCADVIMYLPLCFLMTVDLNVLFLLY